jgi:aminoglycoside phosphotransferase (APT) family kinase protein
MRRPLSGSQVASEDLQRTTSWLISMHRQTLRSRVAAGSPGWTLHVDERLERFHAAFGRRPDIVRLFDELRADAATSGCDLPIVLCHRDLGPWNVLVDREDVRVIDWEVARDGPALTDLVYACLHWRFESLRDRTEANRARQLGRILMGPAGSGPGIASIRDAVRRYIHEVDVDPRLIPMLVILTLVDQALDRFDRLQLRGARDTDSSNDNRYVRYVTEVASYSTDWLTQSRRFLCGR